MFDDGRPLFQQIADLLADGIVAGRYAEDAQVPSTNELAGFYRINPATVGKGVNVLVEQGVLHKRRGLGMFVSEGGRERLVAERTEGFASAFVRPLLSEARSLGLSIDDIHSLIDQEGSK